MLECTQCRDSGILTNWNDSVGGRVRFITCTCHHGDRVRHEWEAEMRKRNPPPTAYARLLDDTYLGDAP